MSGLITRVVRINGEEEQRSTVPSELRLLESIIVPVGTILHHTIEVELIFDPPLDSGPAPKFTADDMEPNDGLGG